MHLEPLPALADNYIWLLANDQAQALVVDPGEDAPVEAALSRHGLSLRAILLTHHHIDHVGGAAALRARHGACVYAPADERIDNVDRRVNDGDSIDPLDDGLTFRVLDVPGHTRHHIAYVGADLLFCGDTLFSLGCGRIFEGTPAQMLASLDRLAALPDDTRVCCGHEYTVSNAAFARQVDPDNEALAKCTEEAHQAVKSGHASLPSLMARERAANPFLRCDSEAIRHWAAQQGVADTRCERFAALRTAKDGFRA